MALGNGIRRDIMSVSQQQRDRFRDAIIALNNKLFPGSRNDFRAGGVSYWFKQDEIHQATHVHGTPAFLRWHRELWATLLKALGDSLGVRLGDARQT